MRISDWSSDVCSSDLVCERHSDVLIGNAMGALTMPAEWAPHEAVWIGFPHLAEEWAGRIETARRDIAAFANAVHDGGRGEEVRLVVNDEQQAEIAASLVESGEIGRATVELQSLMRSSY